MRSSYFYHPRCRAASAPDGLRRRFQKKAEFVGAKLFGCDVITTPDPEWTAHIKEQGYYVSFTDGSARFVKSPEALECSGAMTLTPAARGNMVGTPTEMDKVYDLLER